VRTGIIPVLIFYEGWCVEMTEPQIGAEVKDGNGKSLGTIDYVVRDTWSGDIRKYIVYRKPPEEDVSFTPEDVSEALDNLVKLNIVPD
jgi:hypothetical protein